MKTKLSFEKKEVRIGFAVILLLIGLMALNPVISFIFFFSASVLSVSAVARSKRWIKIVALILFAISIILTVWAFSKSKSHMEIYMEHKLGTKR